MDIGTYMALCLGHPEHGYYMTRDPFGAGGDFTTAPEISQMFGEMIGVWCVDMWIKLGAPPEFVLLECGPGRGTLMADIMRATKHVPGFHNAAKIHLLEMSEALRNAQTRALERYTVSHIGALSKVKAGLPVILVGNEFLDALPVRQIEHKNGKWWERKIGISDTGGLEIGFSEAENLVLENVPGAILGAKEEGVFETSPYLNQFLKSVDNLLINQKGVALFVDYGHMRSALGDTLQAVRSHRFENVLENPGENDITAHVDFENIVRIAKEDGVAVHGPVTQREFLQRLGIEVRAEALMNGAKTSQNNSIRTGLNRLIDTEQMGSLFKVICLCSDSTLMPEGFNENL